MALFVTYHRREDGDRESGLTPIDRARLDIAQLHFEGVVEESGTGWAVTYRSREPVRAPDGTEIHCWPLASPGNRRRVVLDERLDARFETTLESISGFLAFELVQRDAARRTHRRDSSSRSHSPVCQSSVTGYLLRTLVGNAERFLRYLLALLDEDADQMNLLDVFEDGGNNPIAFESGSSQLPVLEKLLRTMRRDPAKLAGLHPLVSDLAADDALPPGFSELWTTIYDEAHQGASAR